MIYRGYRIDETEKGFQVTRRDGRSRYAKTLNMAKRVVETASDYDWYRVSI